MLSKKADGYVFTKECRPLTSFRPPAIFKNLAPTTAPAGHPYNTIKLPFVNRFMVVGRAPKSRLLVVPDVDVTEWEDVIRVIIVNGDFTKDFFSPQRC